MELNDTEGHDCSVTSGIEGRPTAPVFAWRRIKTKKTSEFYRCSKVTYTLHLHRVFLDAV